VIDRYMELLDGDVTAGIGSVSMAQIIRADEALFVELGRTCRAGVKGSPGVSPIGDNIGKIFESQRIQLLLVPSSQKRELNLQTERPQPQPRIYPADLPGPGEGKRRRGRGNNRGDGAPGPQKPKVEPAATVGVKGKGKGKAPALPAAMLGTCTNKTGDGQNICFGFNMKSCSHAGHVQPGARCPRGLHACARLKSGVACGGTHAFSDCT
jgi:hypothetical protein